MSSSDVRRRILNYLNGLEPNRSIQPADLASTIGLTINQVNPSLSAAKKRGEVEALRDGSVQLTSSGRDRLRDGKFTGLSALPDSVGVPLAILNQAIGQVPAVRYALGVAGIAAAASIINVLLKSWLVGFIVILVLLLFMVLLYIFAKLVEVGGWVVHLAGIVFMWFVLVLFMANCVMLFSSAFFHWPLDFRPFYTSQPGPVANGTEDRPNPMGVSLPAHLELVDASFLEEGVYARPKIDVKVRNKELGIAFLTEAKFHVEKKWAFKPFTKKAGAYFAPTQNYRVDLPSKDVPSTVSVNISQSVEGNKSDRFTFEIFPRDDPLEVENGLYMTEVFLVEIELIYNKQEVLKSGKLLFIDRGSGGVYFGKEIEMSSIEFQEKYLKPKMDILQYDKKLAAEMKLIQAKKNKPLVELIDGLTRYK